MISREKQMRKFAKCVVKEIRAETDRDEREHFLAVWIGFLTGMRMTNAITKEEYDYYYQKLRDIVTELEINENGKGEWRTVHVDTRIAI